MQKIIIADTSCLILLHKINELILLHRLFGQITVTSIIAEEYGEPLPEWVQVNNPTDLKAQEALQISVDKGEASALALAMESENALLILDDLKARKVAIQLQLRHTGTLGVLMDARRKKYITAIKPILTKIKQTNFHISEELETQILKIMNEL